MTTLTFHGAAGTVTGSKTLLESEGTRLLVDCGMFQGLKSLREMNWAPPAFDARSVSWVVLTHAHIDHSGWLPRLVKAGFRGKVHATPATTELADLLLKDSAHLQEEDAEYLNRKGATRHSPALPLYDARDAARALALFEPVPYGKWTELTSRLSFRYTNAGHLLGSGLVEVRVSSKSEGALNVLFSGDVGRYDMPLTPDPQPPPQCEILVMESTYGNRTHASQDLHDQLERVALRTFDRKGTLLVPAFAVGRAQQVILLLRELYEAGRLPRMPIHLDSPMAVDATRIYRKYPDEHTIPAGGLQDDSRLLSGAEVQMHRSREDSKRLNAMDGPRVIVSSSGMMTGGRVLHHLARLLPDPKNTVLVVGFQAAGTRGRALCEGARYLRFHGDEVDVRAEIAQIHGMSGHADADELLRWIRPLAAPRTVFLTHGEPDASEALAARLRDERGWNTVVPGLGQSFTL